MLFNSNISNINHLLAHSINTLKYCSFRTIDQSSFIFKIKLGWVLAFHKGNLKNRISDNVIDARVCHDLSIDQISSLRLPISLSKSQSDVLRATDCSARRILSSTITGYHPHLTGSFVVGGCLALLQKCSWRILQP